jgi:hypothetical protein
MTPSLTFETSTKILKIYQDSDLTENPRSWDNLAKMIFFGKHKHYGDAHDITLNGSYDSREDFIIEGAISVAKQMDAAVLRPVHLYSHGGETISTSYSYPYNCRWDSGTVGFAVVTKEDIRKEYNVKRITKALIEKATEVLEGEVKTLDQYISGEVYWFKLEDKETGEVLDSCSGFYGSDMKTNGILEYINDEEMINVIKQANG